MTAALAGIRGFLLGGLVGYAVTIEHTPWAKAAALHSGAPPVAGPR